MLARVGRNVQRVPATPPVAHVRQIDTPSVLQTCPSPHGPSPNGLAAWNDFNPIAKAARGALQEAAEIEIPDRMFVFWMVGGYLLILVPANWMVFRLLRRIEWAWVVAPVIAIAATVVVIRMAQLDIGFARSRTEVVVIEIQGDYPRAHVTRYMALYTSLSTDYDFHFEDPGALVQPFPSVDDPRRFESDDQRTIVYRHGKQTSLFDVFVKSNNTGLMHSEEMVDFGGGIQLSRAAGGRLQVVNRTGLTLHDAKVLHRVVPKSVKAAELEVAELGTFESGEKALLLFGRNEPTPSPSSPDRAELKLDNLRREAGDVEELAVGEYRLLAKVKHKIPGLVIEPAAPQTQTVALVVAHLAFTGDPQEDPQPDANVKPRGRGNDEL